LRAITEHILFGGGNKGMKKREKIIKTSLICFYAVFSVLMLFIVCVDLTGPLHYLVPWKMALATLLFGALFVGVLRLWEKIPEIITTSWIFYLIVTIVLIALIWTVALVHGKGHLGFGDYYVVYMSAVELAEGSELTYYDYFNAYGNNTVPMLILSALIKTAKVMGIDEFYLLLFISTSLVVLSMWAVRTLCGEKYQRYGVLMLLFVMICLPLYVFSGTFYTDTLSFGAGVISLALLKESVRKKHVFLILPAAFFAVWGIEVKITSGIVLIAFLIVFAISLIEGCIKKEEKKRTVIYVVSYLSVIAILTIALKAVYSGNYVYKETSDKSNPLIAWIAMGMSGNGSYADNVEFSDEINQLPDKVTKSEFAKAFIKDHFKEAISFSHNVKKAQNNFASGMFTCFDYTTPDENGSFLYKLLDPGGAFFGRSCQFTFCYISIIYLAILYGSIKTLILLIKRKGESAKKILSFPKLLVDVTFFGTILFLMLWESNNRQLYNGLPILVMGLFINAAAGNDKKSSDRRIDEKKTVGEDRMV